MRFALDWLAFAALVAVLSLVTGAHPLTVVSLLGVAAGPVLVVWCGIAERG